MKHSMIFKGSVFDRWRVIAENPVKMDRRWMYLCACVCGVERLVRDDQLIGGKSRSCGCLGRELQSQRSTVHGWTKRPLYHTWKGMMSRCYDNMHAAYGHYGGRGIKVEKRWHDFTLFEFDMGSKPTAEHSLDRIDNDGPYSKSNCRWATRLEQSNNSRFNRRITFGGETLPVSMMARKHGLPTYILFQRLNYGWDTNRALTTPIRKRKKS